MQLGDQELMTSETLQSPSTQKFHQAHALGNAGYAAELDGDADTGDFGFGRTQQEVTFIQDALGLEQEGATLLDAGCGGGRWALELARRGHMVTGIDSDPARIVRARNRALTSGLHERTHLHACSLAQIAFVSHFDGAYAFGGSFGGDSEENDLAALRSVVRSLKPGARLVLEHANMLHLARNFTPREWMPSPSGGRIFIERTWDVAVGRVFERRILQDATGIEREQWFTMRVYSPTELGRMLSAVGGLEQLEVVSSPDRATASLDAPRIAVVARRAASWTSRAAALA
jgi:SAM-dependent methyltransferase